MKTAVAASIILSLSLLSGCASQSSSAPQMTPATVPPPDAAVAPRPVNGETRPTSPSPVNQATVFTSATPPSLAELPDLALGERRYPLRAGVETFDQDAGRRRIVPEFGEVPMTERERQVMEARAAEERLREPDALLFYRRPVGPEQGLSAFDERLRVDVFGTGGSSTGAFLQRDPAGFLYDQAGGPVVAEAPRARTISSIYTGSGAVIELGRDERLIVGEAGVRSIAGRHNRVDE